MTIEIYTGYGKVLNHEPEEREVALSRANTLKELFSIGKALAYPGEWGVLSDELNDFLLGPKFAGEINSREKLREAWKTISAADKAHVLQYGGIRDAQTILAAQYAASRLQSEAGPYEKSGLLYTASYHSQYHVMNIDVSSGPDEAGETVAFVNFPTGLENCQYAAIYSNNDQPVNRSLIGPLEEIGVGYVD